MAQRTHKQNMTSSDLDRLLPHDELGRCFADIERALAGGDLQQGAALLKALIEALRHHFKREEFLVCDAGVAPVHVRRAHHDAMLERLRWVQRKCHTSRPTESNCQDIEQFLVTLMSDLVEDEMTVRRDMAQARNTL